MKNIGIVWKEAGSIIGRRPTIALPFIIGCLVNVAVIFLLYLAPQRPILSILGPPIRVFFGEQFLHYPNNFILLPKLFSYAEIVTAALFGMLMTAVGVGMIADVKRGVRASFFINLIRAFKRYFALFSVWLLTFGLITGVSKLMPFVLKPINSKGVGFLVISIYFVMNILINLIFVYSIILIIVKRKKLIPALKQGVVLFTKLFVPTALLAVLPSLLYLPVLVLKTKVYFFINNIFPEMILIVLLIGAGLVAFIEFIIYLSLTILFINKEGADV